jgi:hypothetical protein
MKFLLLWMAALAFLAAVPAIAAPTGRLATGACPAASPAVAAATAPLLGPHAAIYAPFIKQCAVLNAAGQPALFVVALQRQAAYNKHSLYFIKGQPWNGTDDTTNADPIPLPILLSPAGQVLGRLSEYLYNDEAGDLTVKFSHWTSGIPQHISLRVDNAGVVGAYCPPPLTWNIATQHYIQVKGDELGVCR